MISLQLLHEGQVALIQRVAERPVHLGRAPINDLILRDPQVSEHHAVVWAATGEAWVRDLNSSNGTFVNGERVKDPRKLHVGDRLGLGQTVLVVAQADSQPERPALVLEERATGVCVPLTTSQIRVGGGEDCDLILAGAADHVLTLFVYEDGELWMGTEDGEDAVQPEVEFEAAGHAFVVRAASWMDASTVVPRKDRGEGRVVKLQASLEGPTGPTATIADGESGVTLEIDAENRAILLYLLGRAVAEGADLSQDGWVPDEELRRGIWGKKSRDNQLNVLLHRLRGELRSAGIDPWFIEKKRRYTRARLSDVELG